MGVDEEVEEEEEKNSPSMTIALPPLVPMSMPKYRGPLGSICDAKEATERLAGRELGCKEGDELIGVVGVVVLFFFGAPATSVPRLALLEQ